MTGKAYLVGAGPGRADLITVRGLTLLRRADVVLYDRLIAPALLDESPAHAELRFVGKGAGHHVLPQAAINALLVEQVRAGKQVVRLKGGDPCVFGHAGEEALALRQAGLPFEIVPGVSSALAAPAYAGIPVTQRGLATGFAVVTGHEAAETQPGSTNWAALAQMPTLVVMMAVKRLPAIRAALLAAGRDPITPLALISRGTTDQQQVMRTTLGGLPDDIGTQPIPTPAMAVIGAVAELADSLAWFQPDGSAQGFVPFMEIGD